eukprot:gb/GEZN01003939.1/.p1 GENE.gb/GEZN01003939.1/~~gb/GEZN01003939.1/.p1  ORF type:complete len:438 (+),score=24.25 gb/GEZN01003939.1/:40-1353(+)
MSEGWPLDVRLLRPSPCRHWLRGFCRLGNGCHFDHSGEMVPQAMGQRNVQQMGSNGSNSDINSGMGELSLYSSVPGSSLSPQGGLPQTVSPNRMSQFGLQQLRQRSSPMHGPQYTLQGPGGVQAYSMPRMVSYGPNPGGLNPGPSSLFPPEQYSPSQFSQPRSLMVSGDRKQTDPCRHWLRGYCLLGNSCNFAHVGMPGMGNMPVISGPKATLRCRHWAKGFCQLGTSCRFVHSGLPGQPHPESEKSGGGRGHGKSGGGTSSNGGGGGGGGGSAAVGSGSHGTRGSGGGNAGQAVGDRSNIQHQPNNRSGIISSQPGGAATSSSFAPSRPPTGSTSKLPSSYSDPALSSSEAVAEDGQQDGEDGDDSVLSSRDPITVSVTNVSVQEANGRNRQWSRSGRGSGSGVGRRAPGVGAGPIVRAVPSPTTNQPHHHERPGA